MSSLGSVSLSPDCSSTTGPGFFWMISHTALIKFKVSGKISFIMWLPSHFLYFSFFLVHSMRLLHQFVWFIRVDWFLSAHDLFSFNVPSYYLIHSHKVFHPMRWFILCIGHILTFDSFTSTILIHSMGVSYFFYWFPLSICHVLCCGCHSYFLLKSSLVVHSRIMVSLTSWFTHTFRGIFPPGSFFNFICIRSLNWL